MPMDSLLANKAFDAETTHLLASTFDAAWQRVEASDNLLTDQRYAASARELLANALSRWSSKAREIPIDLL